VESVPAVVLRRGHKDAGAIFIEVDRLDGTVDLYVPAPAGVSETDSERFWVRCFEGDAVSEERVNSYVLRQMDFDPDMCHRGQAGAPLLGRRAHPDLSGTGALGIR